MRPVSPTRIVPPSSLMLECKIDEPPLDVSPDVMTGAWISQTKNLINCNNEIKGMKDWKEKATKKVD